ncbi:hypothetical protein JCM17380_42080 [Desulfosporosinus burensis]
MYPKATGAIIIVISLHFYIDNHINYNANPYISKVRLHTNKSEACPSGQTLALVSQNNHKWLFFICPFGTHPSSINQIY